MTTQEEAETIWQEIRTDLIDDVDLLAEYVLLRGMNVDEALKRVLARRRLLEAVRRCGD